MPGAISVPPRVIIPKAHVFGRLDESVLCVHAGGGSLFAIHSECEVFSTRGDRWQAIAPMLFRRSRAGVVGLNRQLFVVGG